MYVLNSGVGKRNALSALVMEVAATEVNSVMTDGTIVWTGGGCDAIPRWNVLRRTARLMRRRTALIGQWFTKCWSLTIITRIAMTFPVSSAIIQLPLNDRYDPRKYQA